MASWSADLAPPQVPNLAPPQVVDIKVASVNLGSLQAHREKYAYSLPEQIAALFLDRDIVGLTGIDQYGYQRLTAECGHSSVHDGHDCAMLWKTDKFRPKDPETPAKVPRMEIPRGADPARRQLTTVPFESLASPQTSFTAGITRNRITHVAYERTMSNMAVNAILEELLTNHHVPSSAAGNQQHMSFLMGDLNVTQLAIKEAAEAVLVAARADQVGATAITAKNRRDHAVTFFNGNWHAARDDEIEPTIYADLQKYCPEHLPLFFLCTFQPRRGSLSHRLRGSIAQPGRGKSSWWKEGFSRMPCERLREKTSRACRCRHPFPRSYD